MLAVVAFISRPPAELDSYLLTYIIARFPHILQTIYFKYQLSSSLSPMLRSDPLPTGRPMGFRNENLTLIVDDESQESQSYTYSYPHLSTRQCRICHEEEQEQQNSIGDMEAPCSCSGTVMFAHRNCIQKWCDEKGSTLCEICLKNFEPGYTFVPKEAVEIDVSEVLPNDDGVLQDRETPMNRTGYQFAMGHLECFRAVVWYRSIVITLAIFLMLRHTISIVSLGHAHNPYVLYYILLLRTFGILVPFYVVIRLISEAQHISR